MTLWDYLDANSRRMSIRPWLTIGLYIMAWHALDLINGRPEFAKLEELLVQGLVMQGFLGLILAFYFAANTADATGKENTGKAFDAMKAQAIAATPVAPTQPATDDPAPVNIAEVGGEPVATAAQPSPAPSVDPAETKP